MKKFIPLVLFAVFAVFLYNNLGRDTKKLPSPLIGKVFPNIQVTDFNSGKHYFPLDKIKGKVSLVNVWASWCVTCKAEHPDMMHISNNSIVQIIGINYKDTRALGLDFLQQRGNPYDEIIFDDQGKLGLELGVYAVPETFIVDRKGVIRHKVIGEITQQNWVTQILPLVKALK
jgi:cytochrome c biogenesis protein CcmG/thiol:disulfide interchange protein DsbE